MLHIPPALSFLHSGSAWLIAGAAAASVPVLIHLIMRTKPRTVAFPAIRFVLRSHQAHISMHLLKHLLLLLMRMCAMALLAFFLSRPLLKAAGWIAESDEPAAVILALDTSYSMDYRHQGKTRLDRVRTMMNAALAAFPPGSRFAVIRNDDPRQAPPWTPERKQAREDLLAARAGDHADGVARMLVRSYAALANPALAGYQRKVILLGNDRTARSWADVQPGEFVGEDKVACYLLDVSVESDLNVALLAPTVEPTIVLPGGAAEVSVPVAVGEAVGTVKCKDFLSDPLTATAEGLVRRPGELNFREHSKREVRFGLPNQQRVVDFEEIIRRRGGSFFVRIDLVGPDVLDADNTRWVAFRVDRLPVALVVGEPGRNTTAHLVANAIAPDTPAWRARRTIEVRRITAGKLATADLTGVNTIWLAGAAPLTDKLWPVLTKFVREGGAVIFIPGRGSRISDLASPGAEKFLGVGRVRNVPLGEPTAVGLTPADYRHGLLGDFEGGRRGDLANIFVRRAWGVDVTGAGRITLGRVKLGGTGETPLIVLGRLGKGRVLVWSTGPDRDWSNLARRPEFPILVQSSIKYLTGRYRAEWQFTLGRPVQFPLPREWPLVGSSATVYLPDGTEKPARIDPKQGVVLAEATQVGPHAVLLRRTSDDPSPFVFGYAVNSDPAESDLTLLDPTKLANAETVEEGFFDPKAFGIVRDADELRTQQSLRTRGWDLSGPLALAMLVLLCGESFFANRFYRRPRASEEV